MDWGDWSRCSATCGEGNQIRARSCDGEGSGTGACDGSSLENIPCNSNECPIWSDWAAWSECDVSCGIGGQTRRRVCIGGEPSGDCLGSAIENEQCYQADCPEWSAWGVWSICSAPCEGSRIKVRICVDGESGIGCQGKSMMTEECGLKNCAKWTPWGEWTDCSVTCGQGTKGRDRICVGGYAGVDCDGDASDKENCFAGNCFAWSAWGAWSECSGSCGNGQRTRIRSCPDGLPGVDCPGDSMDSVDCNEKSCASWSSWGDWSDCSATCGEGTTLRSRVCESGEAGVFCAGDSTETSLCISNACPMWTTWRDWSQCTATCGVSERVRMRLCEGGEEGVVCGGEEMENEQCKLPACPFWGEWSVWSECSATCGNAERTRSRVCVEGEEGIDCFGPSVGKENCEQFACPFWSEWTVWSECDVTCGQGERIRDRVCLENELETDCLGSPVEFETCDEQVCPFWGDWSFWSDCSSSCGEGEMIRYRACIGGEVEEDCPGLAVQAKSCRENDCPKWDEWSAWSDCSTTCGGGERLRDRLCLGGDPGVNGCQGNQTEIGLCGSSTDQCPVWSPWSRWSDCSSSCGGGDKTRTRICINGHLGDGCGDGESLEKLECNPQACQSWTLWESWSSCTKSCDGGLRGRSRQCLNGLVGDVGCEEDGDIGEFHEEVCNSQICPRFGSWSKWSVCNATCSGKGIRFHTRQCVGGEVGQLGCEGPVKEDQECEGDECSFWSPWGEWGDCTKLCGGGTRSRGRLCVQGQPGDDGCQGPDSQTVICNEGACSFWSVWGMWGACSRTCGDAERFRIRLCINGDIGEPGCDDGTSTEVAACPLKECFGCSPDIEQMGLKSGSVACTQSTKIASICSFSCKENYKLVGSQTSTCEEKPAGVAQWSSQAPTCTERCSDEADIIFVIDSSSSIKEPNFKNIRSFIKEVVKRFRIGPDAALIGAIRYNFNVSKLWDLKDYSTIEQVLQAVDDIPYDGTGTLTGKAIQYAHDYMFRTEAGRRTGVPKMVVVITDGVSFDDVRDPSDLLKDQGALIVAVGIGNVNTGEINEIASDPDRDFATTVSSFDSLPRVVTTIADQIKMCQPVDIPDNCPPQALVDMVFIIDSSSSIGKENFRTIKDFVKDIVTEFNVGYDSTMFGVVLYNRDVTERFNLREFNTTAQVVNAINEIPYSGSGTRTGSALRYAAANSFTSDAGARRGVPKVAIVITDGKSQDDVRDAATELKDKANVIAIGIEGAVYTELKEIASFDSNVFTTDFERLGDVMDNLKLAVCFSTRPGNV